MVIMIGFSRLPTRCPRLPTRWVRQVHDVPDHAHDLFALDPIRCQIVAAVTTNTTMFYSLKLSYWLPDHYRSFPTVWTSKMLVRCCHDFMSRSTMPFSTIFEIVEIGISRSAQYDLGFNKWRQEPRHHQLWLFIGVLTYPVSRTRRVKNIDGNALCSSP